MRVIVIERNKLRWFSVSQLNSFSECQRRYELERIEKKPKSPAAWLARGTAVHETYRLWEEEGRPDEQRVQSLYQEQWGLAAANLQREHPDFSTWTVTPRVGGVLRDLGLRQAEGARQSLRLVERAVSESDKWLPYRFADDKLAIELRFELTFPNFILVGYIDELIQDQNDGSIFVRDYKSGNDDHENKRQLGIYGLAAREEWSLDVDYGEYWYTKLDRSSGWKDLRMYDRDYVQRLFSRVLSGVESRTFLANPSKKQCSRCPVRQYCEENAA